MISISNHSSSCDHSNHNSGLSSPKIIRACDLMRGVLLEHLETGTARALSIETNELRPLFINESYYALYGIFTILCQNEMYSETKTEVDMCGCMMMHAAMDHEDHGGRPRSGTASVHDARQTAAGQTCGHCGFPLGPGFTFCPNCGMRLKTETCPACGQRVENNWKSCAYCGSPLGPSETQSGHEAM